MVLYCGRIASEKDIPWLVRAWPRVESHSAAWLVLMGDGALKAGLMAESRAARRRIIWLPHEPDRSRVADMLASADAYVSPGPIETFGLSALEALACGTPVFNVDRGAGAELVHKSGGGATWRRHDDADFAASLGRLLSGDPAQLGEAGRDYAAREHNWNSAFADLFAFYARLANR
jgi:alpha-1,6-mannosyltransferase